MLGVDFANCSMWADWRLFLGSRAAGELFDGKRQSVANSAEAGVLLPEFHGQKREYVGY